MIKVEIFSDPICPWCFLGKTWFDRAREAYPEHNFEVIWKPFQLNPDMAKVGMDRSTYLDKKFGGRQQAIAAYKPIIEATIEHNIKINFEAIQKTPNTLDAHRLIHWSNIEGIQHRVISALFKAYFQEGKDIGNRKILIEVATMSGLKAELTDRLLSSDQDKELIRSIDQKARKAGITGVPMFILDGTYAVSGAQQKDFWETVFQEIKNNQNSQAKI